MFKTIPFYFLKLFPYDFFRVFSVSLIEWGGGARHFGSCKESKLRRTQRKGRYSAVKSSQLSWAGRYKRCVQYDFKFTSGYTVVLVHIRRVNLEEHDAKVVQSSQLSWAGQYQKCVALRFQVFFRIQWYYDNVNIFSFSSHFFQLTREYLQSKSIFVEFKFDSLFSRLFKSTREARTLLYRPGPTSASSTFNQLNKTIPATNIS